VSIAYWALGAGRPLVQLPALPHSHILKEWESPEWRRGYELAASERMIVRYDGRGTGLSQRDVEHFSLDTMLADLDAVINELGQPQVGLYGVVNTCPVAIAYAARNPARVSELILWCPVVDASVHRANTQLRAARQVMETDFEMFSETVAHSLLGWSEPELARSFAALIRAGITPATLLRLVPAIHEISVWDELPRVRCRSLIMHRPALSLLPAGTAERVAATIPDAQLALFEGTASAPYVGDWRAISRTISDFLGVTARETATLRTGSRRALRLLSMKSESLTAREREIVDCVVRGLTNREIAQELFLSPKTVGNHVGRILVKLDLPSRTRLAAYAVERGLTDKPA
jgi:DNA-binding CsgD family transcriptional regulator/pimeloyl-ACP methyl ester carboxylesterase